MAQRREVEVYPQVVQFAKTLAPDPKRALRLAIHGLERGLGDVKPLEGDLDGFHRLRVGSYRVILRHRFEKGRHFVDCVFAQRRSVVYELLSATAELMPPK